MLNIVLTLKADWNTDEIHNDFTNLLSQHKNNPLLAQELSDIYTHSGQAEKAISFLNERKFSATARLKATERPKGVFIKYNQLLIQASKDSKTLDQLENKYRSIELEMARYEDPWELITNPTLLPNPVLPKKKRIVAIGVFLGLIFVVLSKEENSYEKIKKINLSLGIFRQ